jgi:pentatricopeptide repeat protein
MYCRCGKVSEAQALFDALPHEDVDTWNILIGGYADHGLAEDALKSLDLMQAENVPLNAVTYVCVLKAISTVRNVGKGQEIHVIIVEEGFDKDLFVGNSLIDMYAKCGSLGEAQEVFDELLCRDIVSWNALIAGYIDHGFVEKGIECFAQLQTEKNIFPNAVTYVAILKACGNQRDMEKGYKFHSEIVQAGFEEESFVGTSLMRMYASLGCFLEVQEVFYDLPDRDVISWTALVAGCGPGEDTIKYLEQMQEDGVPPNVVTYVCSLKCCGGVGADRRIRHLLSDILKRGFEMDTSVAYNLVEAYVKYGSIAEARNIFNKLQIEDEEFWIATVAAYAELGINGSAPYVSDHSLIAA